MAAGNAPRSSPEPSGGAPVDHPPRPAAQRWGAILWPSFFAAGVATMVFFAIFDPDDLSRISWVAAGLDRKTSYTIGFFLFWACTFSSSLFTWILLRPASRFNRPLPRGSD